MREIEFRGKRIGNRKWVYGNHALQLNKCDFEWKDIIQTECNNNGIAYRYMNFKVYSHTIGQYTGLTDKNGKKIYEGDILFIDRYLAEPNGDGDIYLAKWEDYGFTVRQQITIRESTRKKSKPYALISRSAIESHSEIIGNIYENPKLLEEK